MNEDRVIKYGDFEVVEFDDKKEKYQSFEYTVRASQEAPYYFYGFGITGYGYNREEAKEECMEMLDKYITSLWDFRNKLKEEE